MAKIVQFRLKKSPSRNQALNWLKQNSIQWPQNVVGGIGENLFHGWRFVLSSEDHEIYFADCISPGINRDDLAAYKTIRQH